MDVGNECFHLLVPHVSPFVVHLCFELFAEVAALI